MPVGLRKQRSIFGLQLSNYSRRTLIPAAIRAQTKRLIKRLCWAYKDLWCTRIKRQTNAKTHMKTIHVTVCKPAALFWNSHLFLSEYNKNCVLSCPWPHCLFFSLVADQATADVCIFFRRINWTLFSRLMCRRSLLDLNQLDSSCVKTTEATRMEGAKEIGKESCTTGRLWKLSRKQHSIWFATRATAIWN